ncbi:MAG: tRNA lysidine(34) synthetase TilS [Puniceicoccales bacterium]|jgi:tRNA(Ile)-lysidine synthetase-like protein|nr:tRNA lysidine(34) synthetase TilS [Puniceicoccales bacterium]
MWSRFSQCIDHRFGNRLKFPEGIYSEKKIAIACSGGMDSVALVLAAAAKFPSQQLAILHYNHNTRGRETDEDEAFVKQLAEALTIDFFSEKRPQGNTKEEVLRTARYKFFSQVMRKLGSYTLLLAHHGDDIIETMLMRLARGSSEIAAPKFCQPFVEGIRRVRPLIYIFKGEIRDVFIENQIPWCEDPSNCSTNYLRNRIRQIIPQFDIIFGERHWKRGFLLAHHHLEEDTYCLNQIAKSLGRDPEKLDLRDVTHSAIIRRAIQRWLGNMTPMRHNLETICEAIIQNRSIKVSVTPEISIYLKQKILYRVLRSKHTPKINFSNWQFGILYLPTGYKLTRERVPFSLPLDVSRERLNVSEVYVNEEILTAIALRSRHPGDHYRPINSPTKSLKKLFSEKKIPIDRRSELPVLCDEKGSIFWVPHLPPAHFVKVENNFALKITFSST